jgi:hypothetical protein
MSKRNPNDKAPKPRVHAKDTGEKRPYIVTQPNIFLRADPPGSGDFCNGALRRVPTGETLMLTDAEAKHYVNRGGAQSALRRHQSPRLLRADLHLVRPTRQSRELHQRLQARPLRRPTLLFELPRQCLPPPAPRRSLSPRNLDHRQILSPTPRSTWPRRSWRPAAPSMASASW